MKNILCLIPARKGSKGVKNKNFLNVNGKMIIQYTIDSAKKIKKYCDIVISSDSKKIIEICKLNNLNFHGLRPKKLSGDKAQTIDVVNYELKKIEKKYKKKYKFILILQPTCPFRNLKDLKLAIKKISSKKYDSVVSVKDVNDYHPLRMKIIKKSYLVNYTNMKRENFVPRQYLPKIYIRSGSIYLLKRDVLLKHKSLVGNKCFGLVLDGKHALNIDTKSDLIYFKETVGKFK
tara:strand:+ start:3051 stop:3749 length:699 start_codon:yes stop_codon:yes gene_type:complete